MNFSQTKSLRYRRKIFSRRSSSRRKCLTISRDARKQRESPDFVTFVYDLVGIAEIFLTTIMHIGHRRVFYSNRTAAGITRRKHECRKKCRRKRTPVTATNTFRRRFLSCSSCLGHRVAPSVAGHVRSEQVDVLFILLLSQAINFDSPRGGISLVTEKGPVTSSRLLIQKAIERDSGLYTCSPSNTHPNSVRVHIVNGKGKMPISFRTGCTCRHPGRFVLARNVISARSGRT